VKQQNSALFKKLGKPIKPKGKSASVSPLLQQREGEEQPKRRAHSIESRLATWILETWKELACKVIACPKTKTIKQEKEKNNIRKHGLTERTSFRGGG